MIFFAILGTMFLGDALWWWRAHRRLPRRWMQVAAGIHAGAMLGGLSILILGRMHVLPFEAPRPWVSAILIWHLLMLPPLLVWMFSGALMTLARRIAGAKPPAPVAPGGLTRRQFIGSAAAFTPPLLSLGGAVAGEWQLDDFRVRHITVPLANLPPALDGLTIAQVSDVHVGRFTRDAVLGRIAEATNRLDADIVALTGDLINDSLRALPAALEMVRALRARHVIASCEGNHDLIDNPRSFYREADRGGLPLLRDNIASLTIRGERVQILGLPWRRSETGHRDNARALLARRDPSAWSLLLAHHPHAWDHAAGASLTLSGHTHGGQLMLGPAAGFGPAMFRYWSGLYERDGRALVVSNGTGNWFPVRIRAPAEILHLTLRATAAG